MDDVVFNALAGETLVYKNALATVTSNLVLVRDRLRGALIVVRLEHLIEVRRLTSTNPGLLVISCGILTIAAGSLASKEGLQVVVLIAVIAMLFVVGYFGTRRAAVLFLLDNESIESSEGSFREAASVIRVVERMHREARLNAKGDGLPDRVN
jgi:hypothetical protein